MGQTVGEQGFGFLPGRAMHDPEAVPGVQGGADVLRELGMLGQH